MRGKLDRRTPPPFPSRNIPAYAGKTILAIAVATGVKEHPRVCGENRMLCFDVYYIMGTSPRMRGKQQRLPWWAGLLRNIPAYAGKTRMGANLTALEAEHPRVCGENMITSSNGLTQAGTSPRMRGKLGVYNGCHCGFRNIPAYAGKTPLTC